VCFQFTLQRQSKPDWGLREDVLLPWYEEFTRQYVSRPYGDVWIGNITLFEWYEELAYHAGENRFQAYPRDYWSQLQAQKKLTRTGKAP
jgi:hypothetical protein